MAFDYDLFTIGAGSGGVRATRLAASFGARTAIAEESRVGGTCVIRGCVPKKLFVYASQYGSAMRDAAGYGWSADNIAFDWRTLRANKDLEINRLNGIYQHILDSNGVMTFHTRAVIKDAHTVHLVQENRNVTAEKILVAAGGRPWRDNTIPGYELGVTSDEAFDLTALPDSMVVIGGGYIALEFAFIFAGLGVDVTLVYRGPRLLKEFDEDISVNLQQEMQHKGITVKMNCTCTRIEEGRSGHRKVHLSAGDVIETGAVFWAVGRHPHTVGLGLENAGVKMKDNGAVVVDAHNRSSVDSIFAIGDVTDRINLTPVAIREGMAFAHTQFNENPISMDYVDIPKAVFTQPEIGTVGLSEEQACKKYGKVDVYKTDFRPMKAVLAENKERMMMKIVVHPDTDKVLGCHIMGEAAAEMIQCLAISVKAGITKKQFDATCALHPTAAEELVTLVSKTTCE